MLSSVWMDVALGQAEVYGIDLGYVFACANEEIVRLDVSVDEAPVVYGLYPLYLYLHSLYLYVLTSWSAIMMTDLRLSFLLQ